MENKYKDWTKEGLINELEKRNFQYGQLSNKYATLQYELEKYDEMLEKINSQCKPKGNK